ncbi:cold shock domain-containing protein [Bradyrhizobium sp. USDA 4508]
MSFIENRGFGFIRPDDGGSDVFFHFRALEPGCYAEVGDAVTFDTEIDQRTGKTRASSVKIG